MGTPTLKINGTRFNLYFKRVSWCLSHMAAKVGDSVIWGEKGVQMVRSAARAHGYDYLVYNGRVYVLKSL